MSVNLFDPSDFGFPEGSAIFGYSPDDRKAINEASMRVGGPEAYRRFWQRVLTGAEREQFGNDMELSWKQDPSSINLLCRLRDWPAERAVIEIAHKIGFMDQAEYEWLREVIGVPVSEELDSIAETTPSWCRETGRLELGGTLCREVRVARASKIVNVLDAFEEMGWPGSIDDPNPSGDPQKIYETIRSLNSNLNMIRFSALDLRVCWRLSD